MAEAPPPAPAAAPPGAQPGVFVDPYRAYNFKLEIKGITAGHFIECSPPGIRIPAIKYREGGDPKGVHVIPGRPEYDDITLRYGLTASRELWVWLNKVVSGTVERQHVSIIMVAANGIDEVLRYDLTDAWPCAWRAPHLDALSQEIAIEWLTLTYESLDRQDG